MLLAYRKFRMKKNLQIKNLVLVTLTLLGSISLVGCGLEIGPFQKDVDKIGGNQESKKSFEDRYQFDSGGCDTGEHKFKSENQDEVKKQLCECLKSDEKNKGCAEGLRKKYFESKCSGMTWEITP